MWLLPVGTEPGNKANRECKKVGVLTTYWRCGAQFALLVLPTMSVGQEAMTYEYDIVKMAMPLLNDDETAEMMRILYIVPL